jgi:DNA modification methylase
LQRLKELQLNSIYQGKAEEVLQTFPDECVDTIITSPPYWSLRDYKVEGQLGLEDSLEEYLDKLLSITAELKRVLKPSGVMFWVHGNSYSGHMGKRSRWSEHPNITNRAAEARGITFDFKPNYTISSKCLTNQNHRLAILMQDKQGWIQRNDIIWAKPNYLPSGSIRDRFTNSHESIFMFSKEQKYYFDVESIRIPYSESGLERKQYQHTLLNSDPNCKEAKGTKGLKQGAKPKTVKPNKNGKKPHDVWTISPASGTKEAHFAVFPPKLILPMIKGTCPLWVCKECGKPRERIVKRIESSQTQEELDEKRGEYAKHQLTLKKPPNKDWQSEWITLGWTDCGCEKGWKPGVVLDPFFGRGTTALVAQKEKRNWVGIELNPTYISIAEDYLNLKRNLNRFLTKEVP